jgi:hypothetical protein
MKEKIRKKTKRPQTEDMIFTEEDFEDVSEELLEEEFKVEVEEPVLEEVKVLTKEELQLLSKSEIDEYAFGHGIELDRRRSKSSMINDFLTQINKGE